MRRFLPYLIVLQFVFSTSAVAQKVNKSTPCQGSIIYYSVSEVPGVDYTWTVPADWIIIGGQGTDSVQVQVGCDAGNIVVTPSNGCGSGPAQTRYIVPEDSASPQIDVSASAGFTLCQGNPISFTAYVSSGGSSPLVHWFLNGTEVITGTSYTLLNPQNGDQVYAMVESSSVCATNHTAASDLITLSVYPLPSNPLISQSGDTLYSSYPNGNQWYDANGQISGETNEFFMPQSNGDYYVVYTDINGCSAASDTLHFTINQIVNGEFRIGVFPNPATDQITLQFSANPPIGTRCELIDMTGHIVQQWAISEARTLLLLSSIAPGNYILRLSMGSSLSETKITVTR